MLRSTSFIFDNIPSETFGLMIYFLDDEEKREMEFGTDVELIEDRLSSRTDPISYGVNVNQAMTFPLTFGSTEYLTDYDVDAILGWLTGHQQYKWLEYADGDHMMRYKCHLNNMKSVYINGLPVAFTCDVVCDSQFSYEYPLEVSYNVSDAAASFDIFNRSSYNGYIYPEMDIKFDNDCNSLSIINIDDNDREFKINYFNRETYKTDTQEETITSTLGDNLSADNNALVSWGTVNVENVGKFNNIVCGKNIWVMLPTSGDQPYYSTDEGATWVKSKDKLPSIGRWKGCYGPHGFVVIRTNAPLESDALDTMAAISTDGNKWESKIELTNYALTYTWNDVKYIQTPGADNIYSGCYIAISGSNSNIIAVSFSGRYWEPYELPVSQNWKGVFSGDKYIYAVGGNTNIVARSEDALVWELFELPVSAAWASGCYGNGKYIIIADTLYGSGSRSPIGLVSTDGVNWETFEFPVGAWSEIKYAHNEFMAIADKQYAYSVNGSTWDVNTLPLIASSIEATDDGFICATDTNIYMDSKFAQTISGSYTIGPLVDEGEVYDVFVYAKVADTKDETSYKSLDEVCLSINTRTETSGGNYVAVTYNCFDGMYTDGVMMAATYNPVTKMVTVNYYSSNNTAVLSAELTTRIAYKVNIYSDLELDDLSVHIDNKNQVVSCNKSNINLYKYFNKKFLRLRKGNNTLTMKTDGGNCVVTIRYEFLRKVGGR